MTTIPSQSASEFVLFSEQRGWNSERAANKTDVRGQSGSGNVKGRKCTEDLHVCEKISEQAVKNLRVRMWARVIWLGRGARNSFYKHVNEHTVPMKGG